MSLILRSRFFIVVSLFFYSFILAQNKNRDSLLLIISKSQVDSLKAYNYWVLATTYSESNPLKAINYLNKANELNSNKIKHLYVDILITKSLTYRCLGKIDSSVKFSAQAIKISQKYNYPKRLSYAYGETGQNVLSQGNYKLAIDYFTKQLIACKLAKLDRDIAGIYNNIGTAYGNLGDWQMAREYFLKSIKENLKYGNNYSLGNDFNNIGITFIINNNLDSAYIYLLKGLEYRIKIDDKLGVGGSLNNLALWYNEKKELNKAIFYADSALKYAKSIPNKKLEMEVYDSYDQIFSKQGKYKEAYDAYKQKISIQLQLENQDARNKLIQLQSDIDLDKKQTELLEKDLALSKSEKQKQKQVGIIAIGAALMLALVLFLFNFFKSNKLLKTKNNLISEQKHLIEEKHKDITDSITYAHRIQSSLIPPQSQINKTFKNISIFFQPRDIVSGDFYWFSQKHSNTIFALADCTGHGVPGAFMSIIGINQLNTLINEKGLTQPALILNELKNGIINSLNADAESDKKDGMDIALISFNQTELNFAGANQSVYILRNKELIELKGNKQPIGLSDNSENFTEIKFDLQKADRLILYSDGLVDQFGGQEGKKLKSKNLKLWLIESADLSIENQKELIATKLNTFKQNYEQTDDITLAIIEI